MIKKILLYIWQLPQNILGFIIGCMYKFKKSTDGKCYYWDSYAGISLGNYVFVNPNASEYTIKHEHGHQIQSLMLGPLYLIVIGIPSFLWCTLRMYFPKLRNKSYFWFYTESWANRLGGNA